MALMAGEPAPWFTVRSSNNPRFHIDTAAGRYIVLCFLGSAAEPAAGRVLQDVARFRGMFDDEQASFFAVSVDPEDERVGRLRQSLPGIRVFWDFDRAVSRLYGACDGDNGAHAPRTVVLDPRLKVLHVEPIGDGEGHLLRIAALLRTLPEIGPREAARVQAPILVVPRVFEPAFCRHLQGLAEAHGTEDSGFMREVDGRTVGMVDYSHKRRGDYTIADESVRAAARDRIIRRLLPEIRRAYQFEATRMERYIVACYDAAVGGYFRPHRDNTTKGTAHRRFAVTVNLNAEEYEGGDLRFPEFGPQTFRATTGEAIVFSCSLLHEATPVIRGRRYAFLPFLYDEAAAAVRERNRAFLGAAAETPKPLAT